MSAIRHLFDDPALRVQHYCKPNDKIVLFSDRADPMFPKLPAVQTKALMGKLSDTYGKVLITRNPKDTLSTFPPQVEQVQHPFMINATATPHIHTGSFNQTLRY